MGSLDKQKTPWRLVEVWTASVQSSDANRHGQCSSDPCLGGGLYLCQDAAESGAED